MHKKFMIIVILLSCIFSIGCWGGNEGSSPTIFYDYLHMTDEKWVSTLNSGIWVNTHGSPGVQLTSGYNDLKPSWSKTDSMIVFVRLLSKSGGAYGGWLTQICIINSDGTGFRLLTDAGYPDFNPTWTRDGTNQIIINRDNVGGTSTCGILLASPSGAPGDEQLISDPDKQTYEWAFSGLIDGRIFIEKIQWLGFGKYISKSYLLTPNPGGVGIYEEIERPTTLLWHKLSVSPSETMVAYMLDFDHNLDTYNDVVLYCADFDKDTLTVSNPVAITVPNGFYSDAYPRWSNDESLITYYSTRTGNAQIYAYRLSDGVTGRISQDTGSKYLFACFEDTPK